MPRSIWNGTVTFGLIAVPIKVNSATEDRTVHFHQVHAKDGARIKQRRVCSKEGKDVPYKEVAKGYEVADGEYVLLSSDEVAAAAGESSHRIELEEFVCAQEIDPVFYQRSYYLAAGEDGEAAYRLLHDALAASRRVGIGRWVFHNREYLVAVRALDGVLALHTMRFADELVAAADLELPEPSRAPSRREVDMAVALVDSLHGRFEPESFHDTYRERVLEMIKRKAKGEEIERAAEPEPDAAPDLLAALEASLAGRDGKQARSGDSSRSAGESKLRSGAKGSTSRRGKSSSSRSKSSSSRSKSKSRS
jgi:DNA end-binding protein Ku